jgi:hypothetical protein
MEILEDWAEIVRNAESEQEALRIAFKLFDSEGAAMVNVLRRGRDGMRDLREDARELGIVLSDELVRNAEGANDQVTRLTRVISTQFTRAVAEAAPKIAEVTQALTESDKVREYADSVINVVMAFLQAGAAAAGFFDKIGRGLGIAAARLLGYKDDAAEHLRTQLEESQKELAKYEAVLSGRGGMVDKALGWIPGYITQEEAEEGARLMRQRISLIRQSLADLAGERLDKPSRRDEPPAPLSTPGGGGGGGQDQLKTAWEQAEKWAEEAQATIDRGWVNQSERLEEALAAQASEHERFNDRVTQLHLEAQATIDRGWVNQSERLEEALADPDRFFGPMEQKLGGLQQLTEATAAAMQQNFSSLFLDVMQGKLTSFSDFAKRIFQSIQQAAADYLGQIATNFLFGGKEGSGSGLLGNLFEGIGSLFDGGGGGGSSLPSMQVGFEPFARGGVLRAPTVFPMANGLGLAGEDGPEAVMPLTRTSSGDLGVKATGGERPMNVTLNINAVDAESFERLAARNPQAIVGPLMTALRQGGQTRSQLQEVLR